jgi:hypothetical protein
MDRLTVKWAPWKPGDVPDGTHAVGWYWVAVTPPNVVIPARWDGLSGAFYRPDIPGPIRNVYAWADAPFPDPPTREEASAWLPS